MSNQDTSDQPMPVEPLKDEYATGKPATLMNRIGNFIFPLFGLLMIINIFGPDQKWVSSFAVLPLFLISTIAAATFFFRVINLPEEHPSGVERSFKVMAAFVGGICIFLVGLFGSLVGSLKGVSFGS